MKSLKLLDAESTAAMRLVCSEWWKKSRLVIKSLAPKVFHKGLFRGKHSSFSGLEVLDLSRSSGVTNQKLGMLLDLNHLRVLKLKRCRDLSDMGLLHLAALKNLEHLNLARCLNVSDDGVANLVAGSNSLKSLNLKFCYKITDAGIHSVAQLVSLTALNCSHCRHVSDQGMLGLMKLTGLLTLKISDCDRITDQGIAAVATFAKLTSLHAVMERTLEQQKTDETLRLIGANLQNLQTLKITFGENMSILGVKNLKGLSHLRELKIGRVSMPTDELFQELGSIPSLEILKVDRCWTIFERSIFYLRNLDNLRELGFKGSNAFVEFSDEALETLSVLKPLRSISISNFRRLTGATLRALTSLTNLQIISCQSIDHSSLEGLAHLPNLRCMSMSTNPGITDEGIQFIAAATSLETLVLCDCINITGKTLGSLVGNKNLHTLTVSFCQKMCDEGMEQISKLSSLTSLNAAMCQHLTDRGVHALSEGRMDNLKHFNAAGCDLVTRSEFQVLQNALPQLTIERKSLDPSLINVIGNSII